MFASMLHYNAHACMLAHCECLLGLAALAQQQDGWRRSPTMSANKQARSAGSGGPEPSAGSQAAPPDLLEFGRDSYVSQRGLIATLKRVKERGLPTSLSRRSLLRSRKRIDVRCWGISGSRIRARAASWLARLGNVVACSHACCVARDQSLRALMSSMTPIRVAWSASWQRRACITRCHPSGRRAVNLTNMGIWCQRFSWSGPMARSPLLFRTRSVWPTSHARSRSTSRG